MQKSKTHYVLVIDNDRDHILNICLQAALVPEVAKYIHKHKLAKAMDSLLDDLTVKSHELGFCEDPDCTYEKHAK